MSLYPQSQGILRCRNEMDDGYVSKVAFRYSPIAGIKNGTNLYFQIPQTRIVVPATGTPPSSANPYTQYFPQVFIDDLPLTFGTDYTCPDPATGLLQFASSKAPNEGNKLEVSFNWLWFTDTELDAQLDHAANEFGFTVYSTSYDLNLPGSTVAPPPNGVIPSDIPDGLYSGIIMMGASYACKALSTRLASLYDTSAGDQSWSPSQQSTRYGDLAKELMEQAYTARDDYYKGQSRQYYPSVVASGFVLPSFTPKR